MGCSTSKVAIAADTSLRDTGETNGCHQNGVSTNLVEIGYQNAIGTGVCPMKAKLRDARKVKVPMTLSANGFELVQFDHGVTDFSSEAQASGETDRQIKQKLYPKFEKLLLQICSGSKQAIVFNHGLRASSAKPQSNVGESSAPVVKPPVKEAHSDFSEAVSPLVASSLVPELELEKQQRYCLINLWMSVDTRNPVMKTPLGFLDAQSVESVDLLDAFLCSGAANTVKEWKGEMKPEFRTKLKQSGLEKHGWYYFPKMMADEAVIFKQFDSSTAESQVCIHAAIDLEEAGPQPLPERQSVEVRAIVLYEFPRLVEVSDPMENVDRTEDWRTEIENNAPRQDCKYCSICGLHRSSKLVGL